MKAIRRGRKAPPAMKIDPRSTNADDCQLLAEHICKR
jgi:hypothetical protein